MTTISFIVTSYNYSKYITETIDSIKNQTFKDFEIIVVDDASSDNSVSILENIQDIKLIKHENNKGQLASIITGLREANGDYICIIDSDDTINPDYAANLLSTLKENEVALVTCNCKESKLLMPSKYPFGGWYWAPMSCGMFRKDVLNCILNYKNYHLWKICPDKLLFNLAHLQGNSYILNNNLVFKRNHLKNAGKTPIRVLINLKNNFIIRKEALTIIENPVLRKMIKTSYKHLLKQIFQFGIRKLSPKIK